MTRRRRLFLGLGILSGLGAMVFFSWEPLRDLLTLEVRSSVQYELDEDGQSRVKYRTRYSILRRGQTGSLLHLTGISQYHGPFTQWYADGTLRREGRFEEGQKDGVWTTYRGSGEVWYQDLYEKGVHKERLRPGPEVHR